MSASAGASPAAIRRHYDLGNDFYRLWLGPTMAYSAALWADGDGLDEAQVRKWDYHAEQARVAGAGRVLDVGCGWGGQLARLVTRHGVREAVGLTLSPAQAAWEADQRPAGVRVLVEDWADHVPVAPYDAVISVGAFEHFARLDASEAEKVAAYRAFFVWAHQRMRPGAFLSLQTFAYADHRSRAVVREAAPTQFLAREIFQETDPPSLMNIVEAAAGHFELVSLRNDRDDYARTCEAWLANLGGARSATADLVGREQVVQYERYLRVSAVAFQTGRLCLYRIALRRLDR
jgi:cyclopropane-fatty-acyl-phospholipid synthase